MPQVMLNQIASRFGNTLLMVVLSLQLAACNDSKNATIAVKNQLQFLEQMTGSLEEEIKQLKSEVAQLQSLQVGITCGETLLIQSKDLSTIFRSDVIDIFYQKPYASPPELVFPYDLENTPDNPQISITFVASSVRIVEQRANGFRLSIGGMSWSELEAMRTLKWQATGIPASSCKKD